MEIPELWRLDAAALAQGFRAGNFTPLDALDACLARVALCQPALNAFIHLDPRGARQAARDSGARWSRGEALGALDGVPVSLKDNLHAQGLPTTWGSKLLGTFVPAQDEWPVARLRAAGAVIIGKTNLPEFALQGITDNQVAGVTRNPWNPQLTPGGSSGGGAAAVASGCGPLALVTDGGGSTRRPASHTGLVGYKPSGDLLPRRSGLPEIFLDYEVPGLLARTVGDVIALLRALSNPNESSPLAAAPASRILYVPRFAGHPVDPAIALRVDEAACQLSALGHQVEEAPPADWAEEVNALWPLLSSAGLAWMLGDASRFQEFGLTAGQAPDITQCTAASQASIELGRGASATRLFAALSAIRTLRQRMDELFAAHDFLLTPATAALPWPAARSHPAEIAGQPVGPRGHAVFTAFANAAGLPAIALPCGFADRLPTGFQLVAQAGADAALLALSLQYEQAYPWRNEWPPEPDPKMIAR
jgi:aspartyl-tRNA(Asn)/glutamyl-tRNA(Gln) amidotransferase subunit A